MRTRTSSIRHDAVTTTVVKDARVAGLNARIRLTITNAAKPDADLTRNCRSSIQIHKVDSGVAA